MNTSTFIEQLIANTGKNLHFTLPDNTKIAGDLHITEIQDHDVTSVDCGGNIHHYKETVIQLWINESNLRTAEWTTDKAIKIIDIVGTKIEYVDSAELFIEFGDSSHPSIKYSIKDIMSDSEKVNVKLKVKPTACKPRLMRTEEEKTCC